MTNRICFHADESFQNAKTGDFNLVKITDHERGYEVVWTFPTLQQAQEAAAERNAKLGLTADQVLDIRMSSMSAHWEARH